MELGNLNMDVGLFVNLPPAEWGKDKGKLRSTEAVFRGGLTRLVMIFCNGNGAKGTSKLLS